MAEYEGVDGWGPRFDEEAIRGDGFTIWHGALLIHINKV